MTPPNKGDGIGVHGLCASRALTLIFDALREAKVNLTKTQAEHVMDHVLRQVRDEGFTIAESHHPTEVEA